MSDYEDDSTPSPDGGAAGTTGRRGNVIVAVAAVVALVAALTLIVANRGGDDEDDTATGASTTTTTLDDGSSSSTETTATDTATTTSTPTGQSTTTPASGCDGPTPAMGQPANQMEIIDVDGDGRRDVAWLASPGNGARELGVRTAAGGGDSVRIESASPSALTLLVADADEEPPVELFVSDNRTVQLWAFSDCSLQPVTDPRASPTCSTWASGATAPGLGASTPAATASATWSG